MLIKFIFNKKKFLLVKNKKSKKEQRSRSRYYKYVLSHTPAYYFNALSPSTSAMEPQTCSFAPALALDFYIETNISLDLTNFLKSKEIYALE